MGRVEGKTAIVTGGGSGIGGASAELLAREGAGVVVTDINEQAAAETAAAIEAAGAKAFAMPQDVTSEAGWPEVFAAARDRFGGPHILVNNAGVGGLGAPQDPEHGTLESFRRINTVNLEGVFLGCKYAIPALRAAGGGAIVNISSLAAMLATPAIAAYGAGKAGVRQYTKSVAMHCAQQGDEIRCNSIHPGVIETAMTEPMFAARAEGDAEAGRQRYREMIPTGKLGRPEDIANAVLFLASDESRYITGAELVIDGGLSII